MEYDLVPIAAAGYSMSSPAAIGLLLRFPKLSAESLQALEAMRIRSNPNVAMSRLVLLNKSNTSANLPALVQAIENRDPQARLPGLVEICDILSGLSTANDIEPLMLMSNAPPGNWHRRQYSSNFQLSVELNLMAI